MQLDKLIVHRLPGISSGFQLETEATVSIIIGPNGSGKSSLTRAVRHLLWSEKKTGSPFSVEAFFTWNNHQWKAVREEGMQTRWMRDGQQTEAPDLPGDHVARCYELGILDLVLPAGGEVELQLAGIINREMSGGVNLGLIAKDLFSFGARLASKRNVELKEAVNSLNTLIRNQRQLSDRENELTGKRRDLERTENSATLIGLLKKLKISREISIELAAVRFKKDSFDPGQNKVQNDDDKTLAALVRQHQEKTRQTRQIRQEMDLRLDHLKSLVFPDHMTDRDLLARQVSEAVSLQAEVQKLRDHFVRQEEILRQTLMELDPGSDGDAAGPQPGREIYSDLSKTYSRLAEQQALIQGLEALLALPELQVRLGDPETKAVYDKLRLWLDTPSPNNGFFHLQGLMAGVIATGSGLLLWSFGGRLTGAAAMVPGIVLTGYSLWRWLRTRGLNKRYQKLGADVLSRCLEAGIQIEPPLTKVSAQRLVDDETRHQTTNQTRQALRDNLSGQYLRQGQKLNESQDLVEDLRQNHGLALDREIPDLINLLNVVPRFRSARDETASLGAAVNQKQQELDTVLEVVASIFVDFGFERISSSTEAQQLLEKLELRLAEKQLQQEKQERDQKELDRLQLDLEEIDGTLSEFWKRLGLSAQTDGHLVRQLVEKLPHWLNTLGEESRLQQQLELLNRDFRLHPDLVDPAEAEKMSAEQLDIKLEELLAEARDRDGIITEISRTEFQVEQARESLQVAEAQARADNAQTALLETREKEREITLGRILLDDVEQTYQQTSRPRVLASASDNFRDFTQGSYQLRVVPGENRSGCFAAFDTEKEENLGLGELSDGTRAQLLLAVRLAFIAQNESTAKPPIFLDESLTSSDPERFASIADRLARWAGRQQRQVFYLSSNPHDAKAWQRALNQADLPQPKVIDLAKARGEGSAGIPSFDHENPVLLPSPANMTAAEYARLLVVPALNPWGPNTESHLWYLLMDDLPQLHRLLLAATSTLGPFLARKSEMVVLGKMTPQKISNLEARGRCLDAFFRNWRIGRSRPVTAETLLSSGAIGEKFMEKSRELLKEVGGDSVSFLAELRGKKVKRFATKKIEDLESYFLRERYLDPRDALQEEELAGSVILVVAPEIKAGQLQVDEVHHLVLTWQKIIGRQSVIARSCG